jgi:hypothetical protein
MGILFVRKVGTLNSDLGPIMHKTKSPQHLDYVVKYEELVKYYKHVSKKKSNKCYSYITELAFEYKHILHRLECL